MKFKAVISNRGFTLAEILVALAISGIVMTAIYSTYFSQQKSYILQEQIAGMQQNLRAAMLFMSREIRMAGCDPTGKAGAGITTADPDAIQFTSDIHDGIDNNSNGTIDEDIEIGNVDGVIDTNENIRYYLNNGNLVRSTNSNIIAANIDALNFVYLTESCTPTTTLNEIKSVLISLVARTGKGDSTYTDSNTYYNKRGEIILSPQNDNFHRKTLTVQIRCRNL